MYTNCHSYYSLCYGTFSEIDLLELAEANNIYYVTLTDINNTSAILNFLKEAKYYKVWPAIGVDFRNVIEQQYVMIAKNNNGYENINRFLSKHLHAKINFPDEAPEMEDVFIIYPFEKVLEIEKTSFRANEFIGISVRNLKRLPFTQYNKYTDKLVVQQQVTFRNKADFNAHRLLRCIDLNILLSKLELSDQSQIENQMLHKEKLLEAYAEYPYILENTKRILQSCKVDFFFGDDRTNQNQLLYFESREKDFEYLKTLCYDRLPFRYKEITDVILKRLEKELEAIKKMDYVSYFLINYKMIAYAKSKNYFHTGRGSGANSIVAYIIGITNVDPIGLDLYFERFINVFRSSPPDFDIIFSWADLDDMTKYLFDTYDNVALMGTYVTFKYRSMVRELSKVLGVPKLETDDYLDLKAIDPKNDSNFKAIEKYSRYIDGFPRFTSVHSSGIIITNKPIYHYSATILPPKNFETVQFDMNIAEDVGIYKFDILAQRGLAKIKDAILLIQENQPEAKIADIDDVDQFTSDPEINNMLMTGQCMGVFYVESPAMRTLMTKMQTNDYLGLVAASSIIRPGVSGGGMKNQFILRHRFPEKRKEAHPVMLEILHETHGQITAFAGYAFAKGHSASYAVESYQSLYLKKYFPLEFMVTVLNNGGGFYNIETYVHEFIQSSGVVEQPCINTSDHPHILQGKVMYLGFGILRDLESLVIQRILTERQLYGTFISLTDFLERVTISIEQLTILIRINAFRFTGLDKHHIMWKSYMHFNKSKNKSIHPKLFVEKPVEFKLPEIKTNNCIEAYDQLTLLGFPLLSRFKLLKEKMDDAIVAKDLKTHVKQRITIYGNLVTAKGTPTKDKRLMHFGTFLDINGDVFDTVHFPGISEKYSIKARGIYKIIGIVTEELGFHSINVEQIYFQSIIPDPRQHTANNSNKNSYITE